MKHITISKDRVAIRDLWTRSSEKEILFSSIKTIEIKEKEVVSRRGPGTEETLVIHFVGGVDRRKMGALHKAAYPKLMEMFAAYNAAHKSGGAP